MFYERTALFYCDRGGEVFIVDPSFTGNVGDQDDSGVVMQMLPFTNVEPRVFFGLFVCWNASRKTLINGLRTTFSTGFLLFRVQIVRWVFVFVLARFKFQQILREKVIRFVELIVFWVSDLFSSNCDQIIINKTSAILCVRVCVCIWLYFKSHIPSYPEYFVERKKKTAIKNHLLAFECLCA